MSKPAQPGPRTTLRRVADAYRASLREPGAHLRGQLIGFFLISLYVKTVEVCLTPDYAGTWTSAAAIAGIVVHTIAFSAQELLLFALLLLLLQVWSRNEGFRGRLASTLAWFGGLVILPVLSLAEVLGLAHFAYFLTPLGPEEVATIVWAPMLISSSNVLTMPYVSVGLTLIVLLYYVVPAALVVPRLRQRPAGARGAAVFTAATLAFVLVPAPVPQAARLAAHPVLWMALGSRPKPALAAHGPDDSAGATLAGHNRPDGLPRYSVSERPKNVIVLVLESTRAESTAIYNPAVTAGRELLRHADEMVVFDNIYAPVPTSAHALFSILYGVYPYLGAFWSTSGKSVAADSMAQLLSRAGFTTSFFVTSDLNFDNVRSFTATGFDRVLDVNEWPGQESYALLPWGRDDRLLMEESKRFLASTKEPFFLLAMTSNPHHPYAAHQIFSDAPDREDIGSYDRLVAYNLKLVAELYEWMKAQGIAEKTLLLVLGDHGEAFGEHAGNFGHAAFIHEENLHIPLILLHPHRLGLPAHIAQLGSQVDLRSTITEILGIHDDAPKDGMSLLHEDPERLIAHFTEGGMSHFGVRDTQFSYIYTPGNDTEQLYNWRRDPHTSHDLAPQQHELAAYYRTRLRRWEVQHQLSLARVLR